MTFFKRLDEESREAAAAGEWLIEELRRLETEKELPPGTAWQLELGRRETATPGGQRLVQAGFRIQAVDGSTGQARPLTCFVPVADAIEESAREQTALVLSLWVDRALP